MFRNGYVSNLIRVIAVQSVKSEHWITQINISIDS